MANSQLDAVDIELHPLAEAAAKQYVNKYATSLVMQAKLLAYKTRADAVLSRHVDEAADNISRSEKQTWSRELAIIIGGALLGAFIQGFITELPGGKTGLIATYVALGFIGMFFVFWGLRR